MQRDWNAIKCDDILVFKDSASWLPNRANYLIKKEKIGFY